MTRDEARALARKAKFWVEATTASDGAPQAAVVGVAVTDGLELVFDTHVASRKCVNLRRDPRVALAMWDGAVTLQVEGVADEPSGDARAPLLAAYVTAFPDGAARARDPAITLFRVRPTWVRRSDFTTDPPRIDVLDLHAAR